MVNGKNITIIPYENKSTKIFGLRKNTTYDVQVSKL